MLDDTTGQEPNAGGQAPQISPPEVPQAGTQTSGQKPPAETFDAEYVKSLRGEAAGYRKKAADFEAKLKEIEDSKLSETDKLNKRVADLEKLQSEGIRDRQERIVKYEVMLGAQKLGIVDPDAAYRLLDLAELKFDEDGNPTNLEKVLQDLLKAKPYLIKVAAVVADVNSQDGRGDASKARDPKAREAELMKRFRLPGRV